MLCCLAIDLKTMCLARRSNIEITNTSFAKCLRTWHGSRLMKSNFNFYRSIDTLWPTRKLNAESHDHQERICYFSLVWLCVVRLSLAWLGFIIWNNACVCACPGFVDTKTIEVLVSALIAPTHMYRARFLGEGQSQHSFDCMENAVRIEQPTCMHTVSHDDV